MAENDSPDPPAQVASATAADASLGAVVRGRRPADRSCWWPWRRRGRRRARSLGAREATIRSPARHGGGAARRPLLPGEDRARGRRGASASERPAPCRAARLHAGARCRWSARSRSCSCSGSRAPTSTPRSSGGCAGSTSAGSCSRSANYTTPDLLGQLGGEARVIAADEGHVRPFVMADASPAASSTRFPTCRPPRRAGGPRVRRRGRVPGRRVRHRAARAGT